ncbi:MAG: GTP pyrophosphokinase rsh [Betaproteobacteria bacterium ADurb.Bin341]|nr:MAG: GTP pyrophosphokinase rsh [Betaproteobacteria bacterium ADurb.Bin341]
MNQRDDISLLLTATAFAADKHCNQRRKDKQASPYINHPIALANVLKNEGGIADAKVLAAAMLHDTIEDTDATPEELEAVFGKEIAGIVLEVTDDKSLPKAERKRLQVEHACSISHRAKLVKLADKICNLRDLLASPPAAWSEKRIEEYFDWARDVVEGLRGSNAPLERVFDALYGQRQETLKR